jgi:hypothetical protein
MTRLRLAYWVSQAYHPEPKTRLYGASKVQTAAK